MPDRGRLRDREEAGRSLAERLAGMELEDPVVIALPRGGVPVALPIARRLGAPLSVLLVRKVGAPGQPELAAGAVVGVEEPEVLLNRRVCAQLRIPEPWLQAEIARQRQENARRLRLYGAVAADPEVEGRTVILVDDGIATGATFRVAVRALRARRPSRIVAAIPVAPPEAVAELEAEVDALCCLLQPAGFGCVAAFYEAFPEVRDEDVLRLLAAAREQGGTAE